MKTKFNACVLISAALLMSAGTVQAETLLWSYNFDNLSLGKISSPSQDGWNEINTVTGWEDSYVISGNGLNTSNVMGRQTTAGQKGSSAYKLFDTPFFFNPGDSVNFYFQDKATLAAPTVGIRWFGQTNQLFGLAGIVYDATSPYPLKPYIRAATGTEYPGTNGDIVADHWYEFRLTYDFSVTGGQATLAGRDMTLNQTTFTNFTGLVNKAMGISQTGGQYEALGINSRIDLVSLTGCSAMIDNIGFGARRRFRKPSTLALLSAGLAGLLCYAWKKRR